jgi:hypothetical protein
LEEVAERTLSIEDGQISSYEGDQTAYDLTAEPGQLAGPAPAFA